MTAALMAATVVPGSVTALADRMSGPVAAAAAVVVGALVLLILVVWLARKVVQDHRDRRQRRSGGRDACRDANLDPSSDQHCHAQLNVGGRTSSCWTSDGTASARKTTVEAG